MSCIWVFSTRVQRLKWKVTDNSVVFVSFDDCFFFLFKNLTKTSVFTDFYFTKSNTLSIFFPPLPSTGSCIYSPKKQWKIFIQLLFVPKRRGEELRARTGGSRPRTSCEMEKEGLSRRGGKSLRREWAGAAATSSLKEWEREREQKKKRRRRWWEEGGGVGGQRSSSQEMKVYVRVAPPLCLLNNSMLFPRRHLTYFASFFSVSLSFLEAAAAQTTDCVFFFLRSIFFSLRRSMWPCLFAYFLPFVIDVRHSLFHAHPPHAARSRVPSLPDIISCSLWNMERCLLFFSFLFFFFRSHLCWLRWCHFSGTANFSSSPPNGLINASSLLYCRYQIAFLFFLSEKRDGGASRLKGSI